MRLLGGGFGLRSLARLRPRPSLPEGGDRILARSTAPIPWEHVRDWIDNEVDHLHIDLPGRIEDVTVSLGKQTILQLTLCREMMRDN